MNLIPETARTGRSSAQTSSALARRRASVTLLKLAAVCALAPGNPALADDQDTTYEVRYTITPVPSDNGAMIETVLQQDQALLRELSMRTPESRFRDWSGDGTVSVDNGRLTWLPPEKGGTLRWFVRLNHKRSGNSYDAYIDDDWALFRASDAIPAARTRTKKNAVSRTTLEFNLPDGWSSVTQYRGRNHRYALANPDRRFDRPTGWILLGDIGTRVERISGVLLKVAAPAGQSVRRMDMIALMHWTLPQLVRLLPDFPERLTLFSAGDKMWRGGLSAPQSLFVHGELPLISENSTSTLLHEVVHVASGLRADKDSDWVIEGMAEYYSLELLRRSRTISNDRFRDSVADLRKWGNDADSLCEGASTGEVTARAVSVLVDLDAEMRGNNGGRTGLDQVLRALVDRDARITLAVFRDTVEKLNGRPAKTLSDRRLPGCG